MAPRKAASGPFSVLMRRIWALQLVIAATICIGVARLLYPARRDTDNFIPEPWATELSERNARVQREADEVVERLP